MAREDLTGKRFGQLTVLEKTKQKKRSAYLWRCVCDCGKETLCVGYMLKSGDVKSCGCLQDESRRDDITGQRRGHLTAVRPTDKRRNGDTVWIWRCDCGREVEYPIKLIKKSGSRTMCPDCAAAFKGGQVANARDRIERFEPTGCAEKAADSIRSGVLPANNTSGVRGVSWSKARKAWIARATVNGVYKVVGCSKDLEEAKRAREEAVRRTYGDGEKKT